MAVNVICVVSDDSKFVVVACLPSTKKNISLSLAEWAMLCRLRDFINIIFIIQKKSCEYIECHIKIKKYQPKAKWQVSYRVLKCDNEIFSIFSHLSHSISFFAATRWLFLIETHKRYSFIFKGFTREKKRMRCKSAEKIIKEKEVMQQIATIYCLLSWKVKWVLLGNVFSQSCIWIDQRRHLHPCHCEWWSRVRNKEIFNKFLLLSFWEQVPRS